MTVLILHHPAAEQLTFRPVFATSLPNTKPEIAYANDARD
jgi:hypothetical protein